MDCCSDEEGEVMADEGHEAEKLAAIHAAMMEELGVGRKANLHLENGKGRGANLIPPPGPRLTTTNAKGKRGNATTTAALGGWKAVVFDDVNPEDKLLDDIAGGQLHRLSRQSQAPKAPPRGGGGGGGRGGATTSRGGTNKVTKRSRAMPPFKDYKKDQLGGPSIVIGSSRSRKPDQKLVQARLGGKIFGRSQASSPVRAPRATLSYENADSVKTLPFQSKPKPAPAQSSGSRDMRSNSKSNAAPVLNGWGQGLTEPADFWAAYKDNVQPQTYAVVASLPKQEANKQAVAGGSAAKLPAPTEAQGIVAEIGGRLEAANVKSESVEPFPPNQALTMEDQDAPPIVSQPSVTTSPRVADTAETVMYQKVLGIWESIGAGIIKVVPPAEDSERTAVVQLFRVGENIPFWEDAVLHDFAYQNAAASLTFGATSYGETYMARFTCKARCDSLSASIEALRHAKSPSLSRSPQHNDQDTTRTPDNISKATESVDNLVNISEAGDEVDTSSEGQYAQELRETFGDAFDAFFDGSTVALVRSELYKRGPLMEQIQQFGGNIDNHDLMTELELRIHEIRITEKLLHQCLGNLNSYWLMSEAMQIYWVEFLSKMFVDEAHKSILAEQSHSSSLLPDLEDAQHVVGVSDQAPSAHICFDNPEKIAKSGLAPVPKPVEDTEPCTKSISTRASIDHAPTVISSQGKSASHIIHGREHESVTASRRFSIDELLEMRGTNKALKTPMVNPAAAEIVVTSTKAESPPAASLTEGESVRKEVVMLQKVPSSTTALSQLKEPAAVKSVVAATPVIGLTESKWATKIDAPKEVAPLNAVMAKSAVAVPRGQLKGLAASRWATNENEKPTKIIMPPPGLPMKPAEGVNPVDTYSGPRLPVMESEQHAQYSLTPHAAEFRPSQSLFTPPVDHNLPYGFSQYQQEEGYAGAYEPPLTPMVTVAIDDELRPGFKKFVTGIPIWQ